MPSGLSRSGNPFRPDTAATLERDLRYRVMGEVRFDSGSRALYATDASNYRQVPIGVVIPRSVDDVVETVAVARRHGAPVLPRGGGTSLAGQCCNVAVVIDFSKYLNRIVAIDPQARTATVEPGCVLDSLREAAEEHHLTFGPDPATHSHNTLGGMIGNNSCGVHSVMAGRTADNVRALDILTYDGLRLRVGATTDEELARIVGDGGRRGQIYERMRALRDRYAQLIRDRFPTIPRRISGYGLDQLLPENGFNVARALVGTEGTCVTILRAELDLIPSPPCRSLLVLGYPDIAAAADQVGDLLRHRPIGLEGLDEVLTADMRKKRLHVELLDLLPEGGGWLLFETGGDTQGEADENARAVMGSLNGDKAPFMSLFSKKEDQDKIWEIRESGLGATANVPGEPLTWEGWEDAAVHPERLGDYLREFRALLRRYDYRAALYGHFGDGCVHTRIPFDLFTRKGIARYRDFVGEAADLVVRHGGSFSGEHGDGQSRAELLPKLYGPELVAAFQEFKEIWDPDNRMNPGKVVYPYRLDQNLRLGDGFRRSAPRTAFSFAGDQGSFVQATLRCVGVGNCRRLHGGVMCPSYMATHEEQHSTRGRARLLFEMVQGEVIADGWNSQAVHEALDLCLCCKGCKGDCPVNVDMATYKAEFHHHYYHRRLRPRAAYTLGLIHWWSRAAAYAPRLTNMVMQAPGLAGATRWLAGIHPRRRLPAFAIRSLQEEAARRGIRNSGKPRVVLFPDTFNNYFRPATGVAAIEVLEAAGFEVVVPLQPICCGRPLYAWGMLDLARRNLSGVIDKLYPYAAEGVPIVGLEPACLTTLIDELPGLFPNDHRARRIAEQSFPFPKFLTEHALASLPTFSGQALVHPHCYEQSVLGNAALKAVLGHMELDARFSSGCCGMAGSFGFEREHYDVSMACAEQTILPQLRQWPKDALVVSNGYSCREQIEQITGREALHLADLIKRVSSDTESKEQQA